MYRITKELISKLKQKEIIFCHWKSNINLTKSLNGYDDLDIFIDHTQFDSFIAIITGIGFKRVENPGIVYPYVHHFYGWDSEANDLLHLHVYSKIVSGSSLSKSHILTDIQEAIFENLIFHESGMPIPTPEMDLVIFITRSLLKVSSIYDLIFNYVDFLEVDTEFAYLIDNIVNIEDFYDLFLKIYSTFKKDDIISIITCFKQRQHSVYWRHGLKLRKHLKFARRFNNLTEFYIVILQISVRLYRKMNKIKKIPMNGGSLIVIAGLDATGKSTTVNHIHKVLGSVFTTDKIHMGRPPTAWQTIIPNMVLGLYKKLTYKKSASISDSAKVDTSPSLAKCIRYWILSVDRKQLALKYFKKAKKGAIVISDRYPSKTIGKMDSPRLDPQRLTGLKRFFALKEQYNYTTIPYADLLLELHVNILIALDRNRQRVKSDKESDQELKQRYLINQNLELKSHKVIRFDTSGEISNNLAKIMEIIWENL